MKKSLRVFILTLAVSACALPSAFADDGQGGGNPYPRPDDNVVVVVVNVLRSLLGL